MSPKDYSSLLLMALSVYDQGARRTGRTTRMLEKITSPTVVLCPNANVARHIERLAREARIPARAVYGVSLRDVHDWMKNGERLEFDHTFLEQEFRDCLISRADALSFVLEDRSKRAQYYQEVKQRIGKVDE